jgi:ribonucleoside-diphosphate reductase alpha chain
MSPENGQQADTANTYVVAWPVKSPEGSMTRKDLTAIEQCDYWLMNKVHWTEHNPSVTITYQPDEVLPLTQWVWDHRDIIGGMAFLPADNAQYQQPPYEEITAEEYEKAVADFPDIDFSLLFAYEHDDMTTAAQELACMAGACDI